jgi:SAM-dependent methyltransferase
MRQCPGVSREPGISLNRSGPRLCNDQGVKRGKTAAGIFDRAAATYGEVGPNHFGYYAELLVERVGIGSGADVLDVATGRGAVLAAAGRHECGRLVGIDRSAAMLVQAQKELGKLDVQLFQMDAEELRFPRDTFDVVLCSFGLQSFDRREQALLGFSRVLRPGGTLGVVYPRGWHFLYDERWRWQAEIFREYGADIQMVETEATEVQELIEGAGFERVRHEEAPYQIVFQTEEEWWFWSWSHGTRVLFEAVRTAQLEALHEEFACGLRDKCTGADGLIRGSMSAFLITAEKPTAPRPGSRARSVDATRRPLSSGGRRIETLSVSQERSRSDGPVFGNVHRARGESRRTRPCRAGGSAARLGSAGLHARPRRRRVSRTPARSPRHGSSRLPPLSPAP